MLYSFAPQGARPSHGSGDYIKMAVQCPVGDVKTVSSIVTICVAIKTFTLTNVFYVYYNANSILRN